MEFTRNPLGENSQTETPLDQGLLIEAIQGYPYLYDKSNIMYKDGKKKTLAWRKIAEVLHCNVEDCMKMWTNLRDRFVKEKNKLASGAGAPETNWPYYELMMFYGKYSKPRKTHTATKVVTSRLFEGGPSSAASVWSAYDTIMSPPSTDAESVLSEQNEAPGPSRLPPNLPGVSGTPVSSSGKKRKRLDEQVEHDVGQLVGAANSIIQQLNTKPKTVNSSFTEYIFQELEKLPEDQAKHKRKLILQILFNDSD